MDEIVDLFAYRRPTPRLTGPACILRWQVPPRSDAVGGF